MVFFLFLKSNKLSKIDLDLLKSDSKVCAELWGVIITLSSLWKGKSDGLGSFSGLPPSFGLSGYIHHVSIAAPAIIFFL